MQVLCKHDAMSCRSFVRTWVLESVWVLNPDIHAYQWKIRNVSSLFVSDLSLLTPLHCLTSFPRTPSSLPSAWSSHNHCSLRIPRLLHLPKEFVPISASNDFFFFMRHLQNIPYHIHHVLFISQHLSTTVVILNVYFYVIWTICCMKLQIQSCSLLCSGPRGWRRTQWVFHK